jgi:hypothetical protein
MDISVIDVIVFIILIIFGSLGYIVAIESNRPRWDGIILFMGIKGRRFLILLQIITLPIFLACAIYLGFSAWILCAIGVPLNYIMNRFLSQFVLRFIVMPTYWVFSLFYRGEE